jgi:hydrogenase maturation protease
MDIEDDLPLEDEERAPILVLGVGNELLRDEGVGVVAARALAHEGFPVEVEVVEGGTGGFDLVFELEGREQSILVDAVDMGTEPGTVRVFTPAEVEAELAEPIASLHQVGLLDVIEIGGMTGKMPPVTIVGVQPKEIAPGFGLSTQVGTAITEVIAQVHRLVDQILQERREPEES